jgi:hypothetical protein
MVERFAFHVDARHKDEADEIAIQTQFRAKMRIVAPQVMLVGVPNAGKRTAWERRQRGKEGLTPGFPDMIALHDGRAAFLEFKRGDGALSTAQIEVLNRLMRLGFTVGVFRSAETVIEWLASLWPHAFVGRIAA